MTADTLALLALLALLEEHGKKTLTRAPKSDTGEDVGRDRHLVSVRSSRAGPVHRGDLGPHQTPKTDPAQGERGSVSE